MLEFLYNPTEACCEMIDLLIYAINPINSKVMCMILCSQTPTMGLLWLQLKIAEVLLSDSRRKSDIM